MKFYIFRKPAFRVFFTRRFQSWQTARSFFQCAFYTMSEEAQVPTINNTEETVQKATPAKETTGETIGVSGVYFL